MKVIKCKDYQEVSAAAARIVAGQVTLFPSSVLGLPTGSTPLGMYQELIRMYQEGLVDFSGVTTFNLDEYYPIKRDNDQSYYYFMHQNFFNHVNIRPEQVHILNGETKHPEAECENYEKSIRQSGGIDLQILGIGQNGHIGFNEPDADLESITHLADLTQSTLEANARFFEKVEEVPTKSLTMGIGTILKAKKIILLASGEEKAESVRSLLSGKITTQNPSSMLNIHRDVTLIADEAVLA